MSADDPVTTAAAVAATVGVTARQIEYWTRQGWLVPENPAPGSGATMIYPASQVHHAAVMSALVHSGVTPGAAHRLADRVAACVSVPLGAGLALIRDDATKSIVTVELPEVDR